MNRADEKNRLLAQASQRPDFASSRNFYQLWMFLNNVSFGIISILAHDLFSSVIDDGKPGTASFYSTLALSMYSVTSLIFSPIAAAFSDRVGRKPLFVVCVFVNFFTGILFGLYPRNWVFVVMVLIQGAGDNSFPVGYALLTDCVFESHQRSNEQQRPFIQDLCLEFTLGIALQAIGLIVGLVAGSLLVKGLSLQLVMSFSGLIYGVFFCYFDWPETVLNPEQLSFGVLHSSLRSLWASIRKLFLDRRLCQLGFVICALQFATSVTLDAEFVHWVHGPVSNQTWIAQLTVIASLFGSALSCYALNWANENDIIGLMCLLSCLSCVGYLFLWPSLAFVFTLSFGVGIGSMPLLFALIASKSIQQHQGLAQGVTYAGLTIAMSVPRIIKVLCQASWHNSESTNKAMWISMCVSLFLAGLLILMDRFVSSPTSSLVRKVSVEVSV